MPLPTAPLRNPPICILTASTRRGEQDDFATRPRVPVTSVINTPLPPACSAAAVGMVMRPALGGGVLEIFHVDTVAATVSVPAEQVQCTPDVGDVLASAALRCSGLQLAAIWQEWLQDWVCRAASTLHCQAVARQASDRGFEPASLQVFVHSLRTCVQAPLSEILDAPWYSGLFGLNEPMPARVRDAVLASARAQIEAEGTLSASQQRQADQSLNEIASALQRSALEALRAPLLEPMFAALHARFLSGTSGVPNAGFHIIEVSAAHAVDGRVARQSTADSIATSDGA